MIEQEIEQEMNKRTVSTFFVFGTSFQYVLVEC